MLGAGHTKAKMVVRSRQVPESEVMRALVSSALISGIDPEQICIARMIFIRPAGTFTLSLILNSLARFSLGRKLVQARHVNADGHRRGRALSPVLEPAWSHCHGSPETSRWRSHLACEAAP